MEGQDNHKDQKDVDMVDNNKTKKSRKGLGFVVLLLAIYLSGAFYFNINTFPKTYINGLYRSMVAKKDVFNVANKGIDVLIEGRNNHKLEFSTRDIDYTNEVQGKPDLGQNSFLWPVEIVKEHRYDFDFNSDYNASKLESLIEKSNLLLVSEEPSDAKIVSDAEGYRVEAEVLGDKIDLDKAKEIIVNNIENGQYKIDLDEAYVKPKVSKDDPDLVKKVEKINKYYKAEFIFDFDDRKEILTGDKLIDMLIEDQDGYSLDTEKSYEFIAELAKKTDTYAMPRKFNATDLGEVTVPGGIYGWQMNVGETNDNLQAAVDGFKPGIIDIVYIMEGNIRATDDIGDTYIELDLSRQRMWYYQDGKLIVETPVVTGQGSLRKAATPTGVGKVWSKERDKRLIDNSAITGAAYNVPVKYWMPIGWTGAGIHDVSYRDQFGGDIYMYNGSSSCINTPEDKVKKIFDMVPLNTPVVVYESSTSNSPTEFEKQEMLRQGQ